MPTKKAKTTSKKTVKKTVAKKPSAKKVIKKAAAKKKVAKKITTAKKPASAKRTGGKVTPKKAPKAPKAKKPLVKARGAACFWTRDGLILDNLLTLHKAFSAMSEEEFSFHVSKEKNDFADWVEQVLEDVDCATALRKSRKPHTAATVVVRHLRYYEV